jgi:metal-dependent amidase/aminoacylase/carboxypeptidase family protein
LEDQGFQVTRKAYGVETAFEVLFGQGGRLVSINAEYDALPVIGHGCGHHLIAASSIAAFLGVTAVLKKSNIEGRVQLLGCPAEENQGGKVVLCSRGALKGVDAAVMASVSPYQHYGLNVN